MHIKNMQNDMMNDGNVRNHPVRDPSCDDKLGWFKCHGSKTAKCCSKGCLNQAEGEDKPLCDQCNCNGRKWNIWLVILRVGNAENYFLQFHPLFEQKLMII